MVAHGQSALVLVLFLLGGALVGSIAAEALAQSFWIFSRSAEAGLHPSTLNLLFLNVTFGFQMKLTLGTAVGLLGGLFLFRRMR